ncbi:MAG: tyrosine-type recombinase/integrase [Eubacteriales bacterium]|nr:tyrosine-type recombinase/integrase [Eubacteriales bacterium]
MNNETVYRIPQTADSDVMIGNSRFCDDVWDLAPFIFQKSLSPSRKKLKFNNIHSAQLKFTVKQYIYYKLGQVKAQTAIVSMHSLAYFMRFCKNNDIHSLAEIRTQTLLTFAIWMKLECGIGKRTSYLASYAVEDMVRIGQIKGWLVPDYDVLTGATAREIWGSEKDENTTKKVKPIPDDVFNEIMRYVVDYKAYNKKDVLTKSGIIIQSQTGLRISEVLSIKSGCLHQPENSPAYFEVSLSKTVKGEPIIHQVFANELVIRAIQELEQSTAALRAESGLQELFLSRNKGIGVPSTLHWTNHRLRCFIRRCNIRGTDGELYPLKSHQFRATFVKQLIMRKIPIAYVMKQFSHVSIEMTCHYLTLQESEVKEIYSQLILSPDAKIAGICADEIKKKTADMFRGKTKDNIDSVISELSESLTFNPLPGGVCLYDYRRGNCANGDSCFFYNCPNYITEISFLPVLKKELLLMQQEMERTKCLGYDRQWQIQYSRYQHLQPLVAGLEEQANG